MLFYDRLCEDCFFINDVDGTTAHQGIDLQSQFGQGPGVQTFGHEAQGGEINDVNTIHVLNGVFQLILLLDVVSLFIHVDKRPGLEFDVVNDGVCQFTAGILGDEEYAVILVGTLGRHVDLNFTRLGQGNGFEGIFMPGQGAPEFVRVDHIGVFLGINVQFAGRVDGSGTIKGFGIPVNVQDHGGQRTAVQEAIIGDHTTEELKGKEGGYLAGTGVGVDGVNAGKRGLGKIEVIHVVQEITGNTHDIVLSIKNQLDLFDHVKQTPKVIVSPTGAVDVGDFQIKLEARQNGKGHIAGFPRICGEVNCLDLRAPRDFCHDVFSLADLVGDDLVEHTLQNHVVNHDTGNNADSCHYGGFTEKIHLNPHTKSFIGDMDNQSSHDANR